MKADIKKTKKGAIAIQAVMKDGAVVGLGNLRVLIVPDGKFWYAQGLEIDFGAQGTSVEDAKKNFQKGLHKNVELQMKMTGSIDALLVFAPSEVLKEASKKSKAVHRFDQVSIHEVETEGNLPFSGIDYLIDIEQGTAAA